MRFLFLLIAPLALGCGPSENPDLLKSCAERGPAEVVIGTGEEVFEPLGKGIDVDFGPQGGHHIWLGLACRNLGPEVTLGVKIIDVKTDTLLSEPGLRQVARLTYDDEHKMDEIAGILGFLRQGEIKTKSGEKLFSDALLGRPLKLWVSVTDSCHTQPVFAEVTATVIQK